MFKFSICISTFSNRLNSLTLLIEDIRKFCKNDIILCINGDLDKKFCNEYRKKILLLCAEHENIFPIFFTEHRSLGKLWNTSIIHSSTNINMVINDDIRLYENEFCYIINNLYDKDYNNFNIINGSYSHFLTTKKTLHKIGYFDERLLSIGEEDGDISFRYIKIFDKIIEPIYIHGFDHSAGTDTDSFKRKIGSKYSKFNNDFCFGKPNPKYSADPNGIKCSFSFLAKQNIQDETQYPYEMFYLDNKDKI